MGGFYELLSREDYQPNADFYVALLFKQHMGTTALNVTMQGAGGSSSELLHAHHGASAHHGAGGGSSELLRAWAHCSAGTDVDVTVLLVNLAPHTQWVVQLEPRLLSASRTEYELSSATGALDSIGVRLNQGAPLRAQPDGTLPSLDGVPVAAGEPLEVRPHTLKWARFAHVAFEACLPQ